MKTPDEAVLHLVRGGDAISGRGSHPTSFRAPHSVVLSVSALPFAYGRVYIGSDMLGVSREPSMGGDESAALMRGAGGDREGTAGRFRLDEDNVFGRESHPLLGSTEGGVLGSRSLTWKQCLQAQTVF